MGNSNQISDREQVEQDIRLIVGGGFSADSIGPDKYEATLARVRARPAEYLAALESIFMGPNFDAQMQADLYTPDFLNLIAAFEPVRVRQTAEKLLKQFNDIMVLHDQVKDREALRALLPDDTIDLMQRLELRRMQLRALLK